MSIIPFRPGKPPNPAPCPTKPIDDPVGRSGSSGMVGYARAATSDPDNRRQIDELVNFGVAACDIYSDKATAKATDRPGWQSCWGNLQSGGLLVVVSLDRLGHTLAEVVQIERQLRAVKAADLKVIAHADLDTGTAAGRLIFDHMGFVAQYEHEWRLERMMHGLHKARERGVVGGVKPTYTDQQIIKAMAKTNNNYEKAGKLIGAARITMIRRWKTILHRMPGPGAGPDRGRAAHRNAVHKGGIDEKSS